MKKAGVVPALLFSGYGGKKATDPGVYFVLSRCTFAFGE